jgi:hypothetical protein
MAEAIVNGFIVEPGSNISRAILFLQILGDELLNLFGLKKGYCAHAKILPVGTSTTRATPYFPLFLITPLAMAFSAID